MNVAKPTLFSNPDLADDVRLFVATATCTLPSLPYGPAILPYPSRRLVLVTVFLWKVLTVDVATQAAFRPHPEAKPKVSEFERAPYQIGPQAT
jgi:hypothetical protein